MKRGTVTRDLQRIRLEEQAGADTSALEAIGLVVDGRAGSGA